MSIAVIVTDIEGTTSSIAFVKAVLFPYARRHLRPFVEQQRQQPEVADCLQQTRALLEQEQLPADSDEQLISALEQWIDQDRKATPLKTLQGMIWRQGYQQGDYQAHMYPDATQALRQWASELPLYVYSSGSEQAQKLFFAHSCDGDLLPLFSGHFDTRIGAKTEASAYQHIAAELQQRHQVKAHEILFLSDIEAELDAARAAGLQTVWVCRGEQPTSSRHPVVTSLDEVDLGKL